MNKKFLTFLLSAGLLTSLQAKKPLDHDAFDSWQGVKVDVLSNNGQWAAYEVNPQEGDGTLYIRNTSTGKSIVLPRGYQPHFTANSLWATALIKPLYADTRNAKIKKKKDFDLPQDSLAIINLKTGAIEKIASVISYKTGKDGGEWVAYQSCDTALIKPKMLKNKQVGRPLVIRNLPTGTTKIIRWVNDYAVSRDGEKVATSIKKPEKDTIASDGIGLVMLPDTSFILLDRDKKFYGAPVFSRNSDMLAYTASNDTVKTGTKRASLYLARLNDEIPEAEEIVTQNVVNPGLRLQPPHAADPELQEQLMRKWHEAMKAAVGDSIFINQYSVPQFSDSGKRLIIGLAPVIAPDDTTIVDFETAQLDIWRWDAPYTPPQESKMLDKLKKQSYPLVIDLDNGSQMLTTHNNLERVYPSDKWDGRYALIADPGEYIINQQWDYGSPINLYSLDLQTGERDSIGTAPQDNFQISPKGDYVVWFTDRNYYAYNNATGETKCISEGIEYPLWDEEQDIPMAAEAYGLAGWTADDKDLYVYDKYDIWSLDPTGSREPINITQGNGRKNNLRYRYLKTDAEKRFFNSGDEILLNVFNYENKENGLATFKVGKQSAPTLKTLEKNSFTQLQKAKDADVYAFQKANFSTSPDVYISNNTNFANAKKVTSTNPQMADYYWGTAELVKWYAYNGELTEGVLYKPENFDPEKSYPMLAVFYERNSEQLYRHYTMEPSWSWVNYPFYVSRGYVIFVPDIKYTAGVPGESAYNYVCSGVEEICKKYPCIDKNRIGIDGQSWGGYQTAYLVTRTNMFACAGSGAPVANMTSAFGGIRWGTGDSRQAQYEKGQSRIGRNLWESPELYIANSPVFYADRVETPLLIMHNDADGAVPWYQGIEMFMALRRLQKPVWMLQYNGESHNIRARKNRKDITIRLQQFFDHYLQDAPMPKWMKEGISPLRKGQEFGTELISD
jgi:dipeptidyl aminopeptidase/acylaminoacyl peptidase